jgi:3-phosphoshikimate 1-carboxyvinyltransferase
MVVERVAPVTAPLDAVAAPPGSKSITNRALVTAALADGESVLDGALVADDTEAMAGCLRALGIGVAWDGTTVRVVGGGGAIPARDAELDARQSGTTARFVLPMLALGAGRYRLDGAPQLRGRPMGDGTEAARALGAEVDGDVLPVVVHGHGPARGGTVRVAADVSSQFASGLLLAGPCTVDGLRLELTTEAVSQPYLDLTVAVMAAFGAEVEGRYAVAPTGYRPARYRIEPDASAASYLWAAAAIAGGRVTVPGLGGGALQGDAHFADVLGRMGATVERTTGATTVIGPARGALHGIEVDMADISDTVPTLAVVAAFADSPTRITGVGFIRRKESDRIGAVVTELRRCGVDAEEEPDGLVVRPPAAGLAAPSGPHAARFNTYDDHRIAMAFALVGLRVPGIEVDGAECVAKTFPDYFAVLAGLRAGGR